MLPNVYMFDPPDYKQPINTTTTTTTTTMSSITATTTTEDATATCR